MANITYVNDDASRKFRDYETGITNIYEELRGIEIIMEGLGANWQCIARDGFMGKVEPVISEMIAAIEAYRELSETRIVYESNIRFADTV